MPDSNPRFAYESLPGVEDVSQAEIDAYMEGVRKDVLPEIEALQQAKADLIWRTLLFP